MLWVILISCLTKEMRKGFLNSIRICKLTITSAIPIAPSYLPIKIEWTKSKYSTIGLFHEWKTYQNFTPIPGLKYQPMSSQRDPQTLQALGQRKHHQLRPSPFLFHQNRQSWKNTYNQEREFRNQQVYHRLRYTFEDGGLQIGWHKTQLDPTEISM